ncbi:MAG: methyltransferase domain-containing protein [Candidatus Moraniibacteriota bacterium]|nr:MAG: methyltransferase domain-containing protein [Candidatus Moranbacteria bacterium]
MMKYFDPSHNRLVFFAESATPDFWDRQWQDEQLQKHVTAGIHERFVYPTTKKYLPLGSKILEGGCGKGQFVYSLQERGYEAYGIDFAENIIDRLQSLFPLHHFEHGDVRSLPYPDNTFDGYWSLGVIEHFYDGYEAILKEMVRVVRPDGYLFLTFPHMSKLRRNKARRSKFLIFNSELIKNGNFYQFALPEELVIKDLKGHGFTLVEKRPLEGLKGAKDELTGPVQSLLKSIYAGKNIFAQVLSFILARLLAPYSSHSILLVLRKTRS